MLIAAPLPAYRTRLDAADAEAVHPRHSQGRLLFTLEGTKARPALGSPAANDAVVEAILYVLVRNGSIDHSWLRDDAPHGLLPARGWPIDLLKEPSHILLVDGVRRPT